MDMQCVCVAVRKWEGGGIGGVSWWEKGKGEGWGSVLVGGNGRGRDVEGVSW